MTKKTLQRKHMLPMADFAEMILENYAKQVRQLEREIKQLQQNSQQKRR